ncbi:endopeptidase La [bacterium]|nr:endopeptidase La [bacterium]
MARKKKKDDNLGGYINIPVIPTKGIVIFPGTVNPIRIGRKRSIEALEYASEFDRKLFIVTQKDPTIDKPTGFDLYNVGTIAKIIQVMRFPGDVVKVLVEGQTRARVLNYTVNKKMIFASVKPFYVRGSLSGPKVDAYLRRVKELFKKYIHLTSDFPDEILQIIDIGESIEKALDVICAQLLIEPNNLQDLLESASYSELLEKLILILMREVNVQRFKRQIEHKVEEMMDEHQREFFLRHQLEAIQNELGEGIGYDDELKEIEDKLLARKYPDDVKDIVKKELRKLSRTQPTSPEATVSRNYIEWLMELPWKKITKDRTKIEDAEKILNEDHYGLDKIKKRVLEQIAVMSLSKKQKGTILCFVGPPGVGKTSVAKSIARALGRKFSRASFGGLHDESEIRGHRRTYIGALPGKIIQGIRRAGSKNPVLLLDEIDKIGHDFRGDPADALMEVLDPDQNSSFMDNYIDIPFDLSRVMFITTANTIQGIPMPLLDRMEILRIPGYLETEKKIIARDFLLPKQIELLGLSTRKVTFSDDAFLTIIREYSREAGVRELERKISAVLRKIAVIVAKNKRRKVFKITSEHVRKFLGVPKFVDSPIPDKLFPGEALGLAWTAAGGEILHIEVLILPGKGKAIFTGRLGDVMKESVETALSLTIKRADELKFDKDILKDHNVHIHFPEGAVPKDGPSAGIAIVSAISSALTGKELPNDVAMTGEITLSGRVLPIGGLPEKLLAAKRFNVKTVIIPKENEKDLEDIKNDILDGLKIVLISNIDELFNYFEEKN